MSMFHTVRWNEWFTIFIIVFTTGAPVFFLIYFFKNHLMDDPDCSKYDFFALDPDMKPDEQPHEPLSCQPRYLNQRPWWNPINSGWFWVSIGLATIYFIITIGAFLISRSFPSWQ